MWTSHQSTATCNTGMLNWRNVKITLLLCCVLCVALFSLFTYRDASLPAFWQGTLANANTKPHGSHMHKDGATVTQTRRQSTKDISIKDTSTIRHNSTADDIDTDESGSAEVRNTKCPTTSSSVLTKSQLRDSSSSEDDSEDEDEDEDEEYYENESSTQWGEHESSTQPPSTTQTSSVGTPAVEDILHMKAPEYLTNYLNPCWEVEMEDGADLYSNNVYASHSRKIRRTLKNMAAIWQHRVVRNRLAGQPTRRIRCLPYFYLLGQPKCGTTDLYERITHHPHIIRCILKEPHWWTRARLGTLRKYEAPAPLRDYVDLFDHAANCIRSHSVHNASQELHPMVTGEASASSLWDYKQWRSYPGNEGLKEPETLTPHFIHHFQPNAKFVIILRNPTSRLYSDFLYFHKENKTVDVFHSAVQESIANIENCTSQNSMRYCIYQDIPREVRIHVGLYAVFLENWFKVFPRSQFFIIRLEDYSRYRLKILDKLFEFLGLDPIPKKAADAFNRLPVANSRSKKDKKIGKMLPETRQLLDDFYRPYNERLATLLGDNRYTWKDTD